MLLLKKTMDKIFATFDLLTWTLQLHEIIRFLVVYDNRLLNWIACILREIVSGV